MCRSVRGPATYQNLGVAVLSDDLNRSARGTRDGEPIHY